jgi:hypothetical protein
MCLVPMLLMRRKGQDAACHGAATTEESKEIGRLRAEVSALRSELSERQESEDPVSERPGA